MNPDVDPNAPFDMSVPMRAPARSEPPDYSDDELRRFNRQTHALMSVAAKEMAARVVERVRAMSSGEDGRAALLDSIKQEVADARAAMTEPRIEREQLRFASDALHLHRVCAHDTCRRAQRCRHNPLSCQARANVPEPALDFVATLMLARCAPSLALLSRERAQERVGYECWIAGIEAGR